MRAPLRILALVALFSPAITVFGHSAAADMLTAANAFTASLQPEQKIKTSYALTDAERENWNFVPLARSGLPLKQMSSDQQDLAIALLRTGLSEAGYARVDAIRSLELVLKELENGAARRDPMMYYVTIFGEPSATASWGWRFEGHHLSFNFTVIKGTHVFFAPSFIGSNPAEVRVGPKKGLRVLAAEDDGGRELVKSLNDAQRKVAVISADAPREIITTNQRRVSALEPAGIPAAQFSAEQKGKLSQLIRLYLNRVTPEVADAKWEEIARDGMDQLTFAWAGGFDRGQANYYRIQGPTFLIEFDNSQNEANHIHTTFREFSGDFGRDLLREHYAAEHRN